MLKNCSCAGLNENCYNCDGKGYYDDKIERLYFKIANREIVYPKLLRKYCGNRKEIKQQKKSNGNQPITREIANNSKSKVIGNVAISHGKFICENCRKHVNEKNRKRHERKCNVIKINGKERQKQIQANKSENKMIGNIAIPQEKFICENCKSPVYEKNRKRHESRCIANKHAITENHKKKPIVSNFKKSQNIPNKSSKNTNRKHDLNSVIESFDSKRERKKERELDGSRDYPYNYRENGKYGSHSMYDNMGDESSA